PLGKEPVCARKRHVRPHQSVAAYGRVERVPISRCGARTNTVPASHENDVSPVGILVTVAHRDIAAGKNHEVVARANYLTGGVEIDRYVVRQGAPDRSVAHHTVYHPMEPDRPAEGRLTDVGGSVGVNLVTRRARSGHVDLHSTSALKMPDPGCRIGGY